jgi:hypothetical protein
MLLIDSWLSIFSHVIITFTLLFNTESYIILLVNLLATFLYHPLVIKLMDKDDKHEKRRMLIISLGMLELSYINLYPLYFIPIVCYLQYIWLFIKGTPVSLSISFPNFQVISNIETDIDYESLIETEIAEEMERAQAHLDGSRMFIYDQDVENEPGEACSICREEFDDEDYCRQLSCNHRFHIDCIDMWIGRHPTCPLCRE